MFAFPFLYRQFYFITFAPFASKYSVYSFDIDTFILYFALLLPQFTVRVYRIHLLTNNDILIFYCIRNFIMSPKSINLCSYF